MANECCRDVVNMNGNDSQVLEKSIIIAQILGYSPPDDSIEWLTFNSMSEVLL